MKIDLQASTVDAYKNCTNQGRIYTNFTNSLAKKGLHLVGKFILDNPLVQDI